MKRFISWPSLGIVILTGLIIGWLLIASRPVPSGQSSPQTAVPLQIDSNGGKIFTDVSGGELQPASPPAKSATEAELNPQQAQPNFCAPGEIPGQDGCVVPNY